jgi:hypothetical protein
MELIGVREKQAEPEGPRPKNQTSKAGSLAGHGNHRAVHDLPGSLATPHPEGTRHNEISLPRFPADSNDPGLTGSCTRFWCIS